MPSRTSASSSRPSSTRSRAPRSTRAASPAAVRRRRGKRNWAISGEIVRVLMGLTMLIVGVSLLIGLMIPNGSLTDWERNAVSPWLGSVRWLLPVILILLGYYLERAEGAHWDWQLTLLGSGIAYLSLLGLAGLIPAKIHYNKGGIVGDSLAHFLSPLVTVPGTVVILTFLMLAGILLALDMSLPAVMAPVMRLIQRAM